MEKLTLDELGKRRNWERAVVVFKPESFKDNYNEIQRSYEIYSDAKMFDYTKCGSSLFGFCLDGTDNGVRLDWYMKQSKNAWTVDYCYIVE